MWLHYISVGGRPNPRGQGPAFQKGAQCGFGKPLDRRVPVLDDIF